jgi:hypothetical protein
VRRVLIGWALAAVSLIAPRNAVAVPFHARSEFQVNTTTSDDQMFPAVASDSIGTFVVVWQTQNQNPGGADVHAQLFDATGSRIGSEFGVNSTTLYNQRRPAVAMGPEGDFVVVWEGSKAASDYNYRIFGQRFAGSGQSIGHEFEVGGPTGGQYNPAVARHTDGSFVIVWENYRCDYGYGEIVGQVLDRNAEPIGPAFQVNNYSISYQFAPAIASNNSTGFVVVWSNFEQDGYFEGIFGRRFSAAGDPIGSDFQINTYTDSDQVHPSICSTAEGNFIVTWHSGLQAGNVLSIFGQRLDREGQLSGGEFQVNASTASWKSYPSVAADSRRSFVVAWSSLFQDGSNVGVFARRFDAPTGMARGVETRVNTHTPNSQSNASIAALGSGRFVVVWQSEDQDGSGYGIFGQRLRFAVPEVTIWPHRITSSAPTSIRIEVDFPRGIASIIRIGAVYDGQDITELLEPFVSEVTPISLEIIINNLSFPPATTAVFVFSLETIEGDASDTLIVDTR